MAACGAVTAHRLMVAAAVHATIPLHGLMAQCHLRPLESERRGAGGVAVESFPYATAAKASVVAGAGNMASLEGGAYRDPELDVIAGTVAVGIASVRRFSFASRSRFCASVGVEQTWGQFDPRSPATSHRLRDMSVGLLHSRRIRVATDAVFTLSQQVRYQKLWFRSTPDSISRSVGVPVRRWTDSYWVVPLAATGTFLDRLYVSASVEWPIGLVPAATNREPGEPSDEVVPFGREERQASFRFSAGLLLK